jgi:hypothetical protein
VVGLDEVLDELFQFFGVESKECDDVEIVFFGDGVVDFVFLDETTDLGELHWGVGFDGGVHIDVVLLVQHNIGTFWRKLKKRGEKKLSPLYLWKSSKQLQGLNGLVN